MEADAGPDAGPAPDPAFSERHGVAWLAGLLGVVSLICFAPGASAATTWAGLAACAALAVALPVRVRVTRDALEIRRGVGLVRRRIERARIVHCHAIGRPPFDGWGVHRGWLGRIERRTGLDGVELLLDDGRRIEVTTARAAELVAHLAADQTRPPGGPRGRDALLARTVGPKRVYPRPAGEARPRPDRR